jgi:hypothetical protein
MNFKQCKKCHKLTEMPSNNCGNVDCQEEFSVPASDIDMYAIHSFRSGWFEHIAEKPLYIKNRKQLIDETTSRGVTSHYIH